MDLRQLRYFAVLAEELHFRRAAERLNITQAPLSVAIQKLEREIGGQLFHRTQRRVALTEVGAVFREAVRGILDSVDLSLTEIRQLTAGEGGHLRIGFTAGSALLSFFPGLVSEYRAQHPNVAVTLEEIPSIGQLDALRARRIDVGVIRTPPLDLPSEIAYSRLLRDRLVVAMHSGHEFARKDTLHLADLRDERFIFYPRQAGIGFYSQFLELCVQRSFVPTIVQEAREATTIIGLVATGLGITVLPSEVQCINVPKVAFRPLADPDAVTEVLLAYRAGEQNARVDGLRRVAKDVLANWRRSGAQTV